MDWSIMQRVLAFNRFYLPGYQAGGPIVSLANMISALGQEVSFSVVTSDRDINDTEPYPHVQPASWMRQGHASVRYVGRAENNLDSLVALVSEQAADIVYLNSFFDTWFSGKILLARRLGKLPPCRLLLAPRGEFSAGALAIKPLRKRAYIAALRAFGLLRQIEWHVSTQVEAAELRLALDLPTQARVHIAADMGSLPADETFKTWEARREGAPLRICFLSRISPKKNLLGALEALSQMRVSAELDIFGPIEDHDYWKECEQAIARLPVHTVAVYRGPLAPPDTHVTLARHDVMLFPTFGENYGHVIPEALSVGLPVVISDKTPWLGLSSRGVGYDGPLDPAAFARELDLLGGLSSESMLAMRRKARDFARGVLTDGETVEANRRLFAG